MALATQQSFPAALPGGGPRWPHRTQKILTYLPSFHQLFPPGKEDVPNP